MGVLEIIWIFPDLYIMMDAFFVGILITLVGAIGYTFFASSIGDDDDERRLGDYVTPWDALSGEEQPQKKKLSKAAKIRIILLVAAALVLIVYVLLKTLV
jgi:hypothetical protein